MKRGKREVRHRRRGILAVLTWLLMLLLLFIWGHSCMPQEASAAESGRVLEWLKPFLERFVGQENVTEHLVRKMAHFAEYTAFGFVWMLLLRRFTLTNCRRLAYGANTAILVALIDETIQIFTGRGPMIQDVWLDFAGAVCGGILGWLFSCLFHRKKSG